MEIFRKIFFNKLHVEIGTTEIKERFSFQVSFIFTSRAKERYSRVYTMYKGCPKIYARFEFSI